MSAPPRTATGLLPHALAEAALAILSREAERSVGSLGSTWRARFDDANAIALELTCTGPDLPV